MRMLNDKTNSNRVFVTDPKAHDTILVIDMSAPGSDTVVFAGNTTDGTISWMDGELHAARFSKPAGMCQDDAGNVFVADSGNAVVRRINIAAGLVTTIAGKPGQPGGKDGPGPDAQFTTGISAIVCESGPGGVVHVVDSGNGTVRRLECVRNCGPSDSNPEYQVSTTHTLRSDTSIHLVLDPKENGHVYFADRKLSVIKSLDLSTKGSEPQIYSGKVGGGYSDGDRLKEAAFHLPTGICFDPSGSHLFITDSGNEVVRQIQSSTGLVSTIAGMPGQPGHVDGDGHTSKLSSGMPDIISLNLSSATQLLLADGGNGLLRLVQCVSNCNGTQGSPTQHLLMWGVGGGVLLLCAVSAAAVMRAGACGSASVARRIASMRERFSGPARGTFSIQECDSHEDDEDVVSATHAGAGSGIDKYRTPLLIEEGRTGPHAEGYTGLLDEEHAELLGLDVPQTTADLLGLESPRPSATSSDLIDLEAPSGGNHLGPASFGGS